MMFMAATKHTVSKHNLTRALYSAS